MKKRCKKSYLDLIVVADTRQPETLQHIDLICKEKRWRENKKVKNRRRWRENGIRWERWKRKAGSRFRGNRTSKIMGRKKEDKRKKERVSTGEERWGIREGNTLGRKIYSRRGENKRQHLKKKGGLLPLSCESKVFDHQRERSKSWK